MPRFSPLAAALLSIALLLATGGCGEKFEPDIDQVKSDVESLTLGPALDRLRRSGSSRPTPIEGTWRGTLKQAGSADFQIRADIASLTDPARNIVRYGAPIDCAGTWRYTGAQGDAATFEETIDSGAGGKCKGTGTVRLELLSADRLSYAFSGGGVQSRGVLSRS